jgi:acyl carrier protein
MANKIDLKETINRVLEEEFEIDADRLTPDAALFTDLELDSLDIVDLIVALEQAFGIKIRAEAAQTFRDIRTLNDLYTAIDTMYQEIQNRD